VLLMRIRAQALQLLIRPEHVPCVGLRFSHSILSAWTDCPMDTLTTPKPRKTPKSLNQDLARKQASLGMTTQDIATQQGVTYQAVWQFFLKTKPQRQALDEFKIQRADLLANFQAKCLDLQTRILNSYDDDAILLTLKPSEKTGLLMALNASAGTSFDKERLERGKSTENVQVLNKLITEAHSTLFKPLKSVSLTEPGAEPTVEK
jgi:hypothetical protein